MTRNRKIVSRSIGMLLSTLLIFSLAFFISCDDGGEPEPELYDLSGVYTFKKAILQTEIQIPGIPIPIPAGRDITKEMSDGLLDEAPCKDPDNGAVELKSNFKLFFVCIGEEDELDAGTWMVDDERTELTLNLSVSTGNLALKLKDLEIDEVNDVIGGTISSFPITKTLLAGFLEGVPGADIILGGLDENFTILVDVDIEFQKVTG